MKLQNSSKRTFKTHCSEAVTNQVVQSIFNKISNPSRANQTSTLENDNEFRSNLYLLIKGAYLKQHNPSIEQEQLNKDELIRDEEIVISHKQINLIHQDHDFWQKESMAAIYSFDFNHFNKQPSIQQEKKNQNTMLKAKEEFINKNFQQFLMQQTESPSTNLNPYVTTTLPDRIRNSFCLYNRTQNQNRIHTTTNFELYCGRGRSQQHPQSLTNNPNVFAHKHIPGGSSLTGENYNIISNHLENTPFQQLYHHKLQACKQIAHAYVYSGYGYRKYISHGFDIEMKFYRAYLASMMRVVFRQLEKFVFESTLYKKMYNITSFEVEQDLYEPTTDQLPDNPRERVPYKQFQCVIRPLYHAEKNLEDGVVKTWKKIFRVTFNLDESTFDQMGQDGQQVPVINVEKAEEMLTEQEIVDCYLAVRKLIKDIVSERMVHDMKRIGLDPTQGLDIHKKKGQLSKYEANDDFQNESDHENTYQPLPVTKQKGSHGYYKTRVSRKPFSKEDSDEEDRFDQQTSNYFGTQRLGH